MYTSYVNYVIWFSDQAEYNAAVALAGGNGWGHCPFNAASTFGITWPLAGGGPISGTKGIYGFPPYGIPASPGPGIEVYHPNASGVFLKSDVDSVIVPGQAGNPASIWPAGDSMNLVWWGNIIYSASEVGGAPPVTPMPQRRWMSGFEHNNTNHELGTGYTNQGSRRSSRTLDGYGLTIVRDSPSGSWSHSVDTYRPGLTPKKSWERIYIRVRQAPTTVNQRFWRFHTTINSINGGTLGITTAGEIIMENLPATGIYTTLGTSVPLTLNKWYKLDILLNLPTVAGDIGRLRLYINGSLAIDGTANTGTGIDFISTHTYTEVASYPGEVGIQMDIDDWMGADIPENGGVESLDSIDWLLGTHIRSSNVISGTMGTWVGSIGFANQYIDPEFANSSIPTSSTALDTIEGLTDIVDTERFPGAVLGIASIAAGAYVKQTVGSATARVGYKLAGGATVWANASLTTTASWFYNYYNPSGLTLPFLANPFSVLFEKANNANATSIYGLAGLIEYVGAWGREDEPTLPIDLSNLHDINVHNSRFANSEWGIPGLGPLQASCYAVGGTYVGNDTVQNINLPGPAHFIWIRPTSGAVVQGIHYIGPHVVTHQGQYSKGIANGIVRLWVDDTGQYKFTVTGSWGGNNATGVTYQYIAFCDPGMRFCASGAYMTPTTATSYVVPMWLGDFTPQALMHVGDFLFNNTTTELFKYKGPGQVGTTGSNLTGGTALADFGSFAAGVFNVGANSINAAVRTQYTFSAWRMFDPDGFTMVQLFGYIGDGLGARIINFPYITGRYPLFAMVVSRAGTSYARDPSHTGNNSNSISAGVSTTAITGGGKDYITIGSTLNSNLAIYDVFIILGDTAGWNNGTFTPPSVITPGTWSEPPFTPPDQPIITMDGGMDFNGEVGLLAIQNMSGIYTLVPGKTDDTIYTGFGAATVDVKKPDPTFKTGYIGG